MTLCTVTGTVVATAKIGALTGRKLLICRPVDPRTKRSSGGEMVAVDAAQAGIGDTVLVCDEGNAARLILADKEAPVRTMVVAVVDRVD